MKRHYNQTDYGRAKKLAHISTIAGRNRKGGRLRSSDVKECCGCLYRLGFGLTAISRRFRINKNVARKVLVAAKIFLGKAANRISRPRRFGLPLYSGTTSALRMWSDLIIANYRSETSVLKQDPWRNHPELLRGMANARARKFQRLSKALKSNYFIASRIRTRISLTIRRRYKSASTLELLGCSIEHLRSHLESQFKDGMNWDNYGLHGWHIDHKRCCASFDLSQPEQQRECFHYTNLQPM